MKEGNLAHAEILTTEVIEFAYGSIELGSSIESASVGSGVGIDVGETSGSGVTDGSGCGANDGSGETLTTGVGETSGNTIGSGFWVRARISVAGSAETSEGVGFGLALATTTSVSSDLGAGTKATETEVSGKFSVEKNAPAVPSELLDPSFNTDENSDPAEEPPTTKVVSKAVVSFEEVFTLQIYPFLRLLPVTDIQETYKSGLGVHFPLISEENRGMHILLVEDDPSVAASVIDGLVNASMDVKHVSNGAEAISLALSENFDLILLDLGLPDMDGQDVCRSVREKSRTPIIILSARSDEIDRVLALEFGADDYMVKPFGMRELVARIRAVARRAGPADQTIPTATQDIGQLSIDRRTQKVFVNGQDVYLTPKEFGLLAYLATDPGAVYRRNDIMSEVWDTNWYGTTKTVDAHVAALRKKLGNQEWIEAVRGVGFRLGVPDS